MTGLRGMQAGFWLARRDLRGRPGSFLAGSLVVAVIVSLGVAAEVILRAKGQAVRTEIDRMGPALRLVPAGNTGSDLARFDLGPAAFDQRMMDDLRAAIAPLCRVLDGRLVVRETIQGRSTPVIGVDPDGSFASHGNFSELEEGRVWLGSELARTLMSQPGEELVLGGRAARIAGILGETASADDLAAFVPLEPLQRALGREGAVNLIDVYPRQGVEPAEVIERLDPWRSRVHVLEMDRGRSSTSSIARMEAGLERHRRAWYGVSAFVLALCIFIWSHLNAVEKRIEVATLVALGCGRGSVLLLLATQAAAVGAAGTLLGYGLGALIALAQDHDGARNFVFSLKLLSAMELGAVLACVLGALPAGLLAGLREHAAVLQES